MSYKLKSISVAELESMHTGSLMSRRKALLKCEESFELSDQVGYNSPINDGITIEFKDSKVWKQAYQDLKNILSTRENILNKQERKEIRQVKAKSRK
ncbi:MAG: hypothetical protein MJK11_20845 [Pseudomonadales bacterium]|nr:hypothetical protein [Pseudomonadales bacterium]